MVIGGRYFYVIFGGGYLVWLLKVVLGCGCSMRFWRFYLVIESCSWMWLLDVFFGGNYLLWLLVVVTW